MSTWPALKPSMVRACVSSSTNRDSISTDDRELAQPLAEDVEVLLGEHCRRREQGDLLSAHRRLERRAQGKLGLAEPDVATKQPVHRPVGLHVRLDLRQRRDLVGSLFIRKGRLELLLPGGVGRESDTRPGLSQRIDP